MEIVLVSIQVGAPRVRDLDGSEPWRTAIVKEQVRGPVWLGVTNLKGDLQADSRNHGGPDQAVLGYAAAHYEAWRAELGDVGFIPGAFGENFTIGGLTEDTVCVGDVYEVGSALVQVSHPRGPCWKIEWRWGVPGLLRLVERSGRTGWYHRVLREGEVAAGQPMRLAERPHPEWTIRRVARVSRKPKADPEAAVKLTRVEAFTARHRAALSSRL